MDLELVERGLAQFWVVLDALQRMADQLEQTLHPTDGWEYVRKQHGIAQRAAILALELLTEGLSIDTGPVA